jgi:hypothetical protein
VVLDAAALDPNAVVPAADAPDAAATSTPAVELVPGGGEPLTPSAATAATVPAATIATPAATVPAPATQAQ